MESIILDNACPHQGGPLLLNNGELGKISKEQRAGQWDVWQTSLRNPDFSVYAESCGALGEALAHDGPSMVEVVADPELI